MARVRYSKYSPDPGGDIDLEDLMNQLKDFFLDSGFYSKYVSDNSQSLAGLRKALAEILSENESLSEDWRESLKDFARNYPNGSLPPELEELLNQIMQRLLQEGYL